MVSSILVIEDNPLLRDNIKEILELEDYHVHVAENGKIGLEMAFDLRPDLILSDINMPLLNGFEVLEAIRANPETSAIPFIFLSVKRTLEDQNFGNDLGASSYITKPFDMKDLLHTVSSHLNQ